MRLGRRLYSKSKAFRHTVDAVGKAYCRLSAGSPPQPQPLSAGSHPQPLYQIEPPSPNYLARPDVAEAVRTTVGWAKQLTQYFPGGRRALDGKTILEIGPGQDFGVSLLLMGYGAQAVVVDPYLFEWDDGFHPRFYEALKQAARQRFPDFDVRPIDTALRVNGYEIEGLTAIKTNLSSVPELANGSIDYHFSAAVLEHIPDIVSAIQELGRVVAIGSFGVHQVDFRDHRNFKRPLDFLTLDDRQFEKMVEERAYTCGNRVRAHELEHLLAVNGFKVKMKPNCFVEEDYLRSVSPDLLPRFRDVSLNELRIAGACFFLSRTQ